MTQLPDRISDVLEDTASEARIARNWRAIDRGRAPRPRPRAAWIAGGVTVAAAAALLLWLWPSSEAAGPLALRDGSAIPTRVDERAELSDGSTIGVGGGLELQRNDGAHVDWLLTRGRARFDVTPGGPRTWTVEIGLATVEVVGTAFVVERGPGWARVAVERGRVRVTGERVPDRAVLLGAGEELRVEREPEARPEPSISDAPAPPEAVDDPEPPGAPEPPASTPAEASGAASLDAEALMARADEARAAGRLEEAASLLRRAALRRGDPSSGVAAFTLGRLELRALRRPARAAEAFGWALERPLTPRLREDAAALRVEALRAAGEAEAAAEAASAYLRDFPEGRHVDRMREAPGDE